MKFISWWIKGKNDQSLICGGKIVEFGIAVGYGATACFVGHNHPSGSLEASPEDIVLTRSLLQVMKLVDIQLLDHLVITQESFTSIREITSGIWV